jgi:hypothetical protein
MTSRAAAESLEQSKKRIRDAVSLFENKEGSRQVDLREVPCLVRHLGVNPSVAVANGLVEKLQAAQDTSGGTSSLLTLEQLESVLSSFLVQQVRQCCCNLLASSKAWH